MDKHLRNRRIKLYFREDIEPNEVLLDSFAQKKEKDSGSTEKKLEVPLSQKTSRMFFAFCFLTILLLLAKTFQLQIIEGKNFSKLSQENKFTIRQIQAERGVIYDRYLKQLVFNRPSFDLILNINNLPKTESEKMCVLKEVSEIIKKDVKDLKKEIEESKEEVLVISENLQYQELILVESKINELPGVQIQNNPIRDYKDGETYSHLIGYTNKIGAEELKRAPDFYSIADYVGRDGIENSYEEILRKNPGKLQIERDAQGNIISKEITQLPESGESLVLWLDSELQKKIQTELERILASIGTKKAAAVAIDPKTGGVLALVSLPSFDNNLFQKGADPKQIQELLNDPLKLNPLFNRVISGKYLTGSTIKPLIASAALEEKIISPEKKINCQGKIVIPNRYDPAKKTEMLDWTTHGWTDLKKAIAESCNVYFYTLGGGYEGQEGLGPTRIKKYLELFGWGDAIGIDLPGETAGFIPTKEWKKETLGEGWWDGDTYNFSIGQGFLGITPLEVAAAFGAIANGGKLLQPQVVQKIVDTSESSLSTSSLKVIKEFEPKIIRQNFINPQNLQVVREGMRQAVSGENSPQASSVLLNSLPVAVAAKTGTAELGGNSYHNWITVFAPYEDPQIVLTIVIENVKGLQVTALPVAREVLNWYFSQR